MELLLVQPPSSHGPPLLPLPSLTAAAAVSVVADIAAAVGIGLALLPPPWHTSGGVVRAWLFLLLLPPSLHRLTSWLRWSPSCYCAVASGVQRQWPPAPTWMHASTRKCEPSVLAPNFNTEGLWPNGLPKSLFSLAGRAPAQ